MNKIVKYIVIFAAIFIPAAFLWAQTDESQADLRISPDMEAGQEDAQAGAAKVTYPSYINLDANCIEMNGDDWSDLAEMLDSASVRRINIVHIGDSHLQADMATAVTRTRLGNRYGSAGRALITPFKLAGTNEPVDYSVKSNVAFEQSRLLKTPWPTAMGFTGVGIRPRASQFDLSISAGEPFDSVEIFYTGESLEVIGHECSSSRGITSFSLGSASCDVNLRLSSPSTVDIHGFNLIKGKAGVAYHVIGNNGATYGTYNGIRGFAEDVSRLSPSLIVISLGTNEAFGKVSDSEMKSQMRTLINSLKVSCPEAHFLLTTPSECQRRTSRATRRRKSRTVSYAVNDNVKRLRNSIIQFGKAEGIPVYDFYAVAGGDGSSAKWLKDGNMNSDRIHLLRPGYTIQGHLFTDALEEAVDNFRPAL